MSRTNAARAPAQVERVDDVFSVDVSDGQFVVVYVQMPKRPQPGKRLTLAHGAPPNLGFNVGVEAVGTLREDRDFRPVPGAYNVDVKESAAKNQVVLRFDRTQDVTGYVTADPFSATRTVATTGGAVTTGGVDVSLTVVYVFSEPADEDFYESVYGLLYPRYARGLADLNMWEVYEHVRSRLNLRYMTPKTFQGIRDAVRAYQINISHSRVSLGEGWWRSQDF